MFACYAALLLYFKTRGGYKPVQLAEMVASPDNEHRSEINHGQAT